MSYKIFLIEFGVNALNNKITIAVDIDDVLIDLLGSWCECLNVKYNLNISADDISEWDMSKFYPMLTKDQIYDPIHRDSFWKSVSPKPYAAHYLKKLIDDGFQIYLCTATDYRNIQAKYEYVIDKYFPFIQWSHVIVAYNKQMIKADVLIDDGVHNLEGGEFIKVLMTAPHNKNYNAAENGMYRANDWREAYEIIHQRGIV